MEDERDPVELVQRLGVLADLRCGVEVARLSRGCRLLAALAPFPRTERHARLVDRDAPQPAGEGIEAPSRARGLHDPDERFLRRVLGVLGVTNDRVREAEDGRPVTLDERPQGVLVPLVTEALEERLVARARLYQ